MVQTLSRTPPAASAPDLAIEIRDLRKTYRGRDGLKTALHGVSLAIPRGSVFGLLGPNGAGKSTMINILAGLVRKTAGTALIWGHDIDTHPRAAKEAIGIVPQEINFDPFFTPRELLDVQAGMYGVPRRERRTMEILETVGLADKADSYARALSGGMRRRLLVAKAMVHAPPILVLDEPTAGVDVELRRQMWDTVRALNARGVTILLTTHYLEEAEELCGRIAIINHGRVVAHDTTANLLGRLDSKRLILTLAARPDPIPPGLTGFAPQIDAEGRLVLSYRPSQTPAGAILDLVRAGGLDIRDIRTEETDLEDLFLRLTAD